MTNATSSDPAEEFDTWYDQMGGEAFFTRLVGGFYERVAVDPILRPMYPDEDLEPAERRLRMFLMQYWGGPKTYSEERGHPRLRMRHAPFPVSPEARDRWVELMGASLADLDGDPQFALDEVARAELWTYLQAAASAMVNQNPAWQ